VSRKKFRREPTEDEWAAEVAEIKLYRDLDRPPFRRSLELLARKLEELGRAAHRDADRLEGLSMFSDAKFKDVEPFKYERTRVEKQLKRPYEEQLYFIRPQLDRLIEPGNGGKPNLYYPRGNLRRQAATLLDAAEHIDDELEAHEQRVAELRRLTGNKSGKGRRPKTARRRMARMLVKWSFTPAALSDRLRKSGIAVEPENLKVASWLAGR
jgi:hypothetical protein